MTDLLAALVSSLTVVGVALGLQRLRVRKESAVMADRFGIQAVTVAPDPGRRALLEGFAGGIARTRLGARLETYAASAHPTVTFSDFLAIGICAVIGGALAGTLLLGPGLPATASALAAPFALDRAFLRVHGRRSGRLEQQLPDALALQAGTLRAGHSLVRSLRVLNEELKPPLQEEASHTLAEIDLGNTLEEALGRLTERCASRDIELWVTAMLVHRHTGGNLAAVIDSLAQRVAQRLQLRGEIRALTAQGRLSGLVVAIAPLAFLILLSVGSREQMQVLYATPLGWGILAAGLVLNGLGLTWIRWIVRIRP